MNEIKARIRVAPDHTITGVAPAAVPVGEHEVTIVVPRLTPAARKPFRLADFPVDHTTWDDSISLRREDMYGDDGR
jgi:hypothetical protein